nr:putative toxin-antitoxin system toxin component, PIN family [Fimbriiglobus ruber]
MVFLQATARPSGPAAACFRHAEDGRIRLVTSDVILREIRNVLDRPKVRAKNPQLTDASIAAFLTRLNELAPPRTDAQSVFRYPRDPKDEPYLNLAIAENADYLVSWDKDILDLATSDGPEARIFRNLAPRLQIMNPADFLALMRRSTAPATKPQSDASSA